MTKEEKDCLKQLTQLLDGYGKPSKIMSLAEMAQSLQETDLLLLPRRGTRSPWASKAGDIFSAILPNLRCRVEKGVLISDSKAPIPEGLVSIPKRLASIPAYDRMTEELFNSDELPGYFDEEVVESGTVSSIAPDQLKRINREWGLALSHEELQDLADFYHKARRQTTDLELMAYAQLNSEHCRHKVFNSQLRFNGKAKADSLFSLIKSTSKLSPLISAYKDNAAIFETRTTDWDFHPAPIAYGHYSHKKQKTHLVFKAETHNHPTFVSPYPGAATGVGGEIRDELACGRGAHSKAGFVGFNVSELNIMASARKWERGLGTPIGKASGLGIMLQAPLGGSNYANEYGRPNLAGYFRTLSCVKDGIEFGYHKPLMLAGGWGEIHSNQLNKKITDPAALLIVLGEPALRIGMGGSSTSSRASQDEQQQLDFASVQRDNAEMGRRCAEVIQQCAQLGDKNPIQFIHDLGAGGVGNAIAEVLKDNDCGGEIQLEKIPIADKTMIAREIWNNESQERFIIATADPELFANICRRENAPFAIIGKVNSSKRLRLITKEDEPLMDAPLELFFPNRPLTRSGNPPKGRSIAEPPKFSEKELEAHATDVLRLPAVASKSFLITIGDRSVGGLTAREQLVGPWQQPVSDYAATMADYESYHGEVCALGERSPVAVINAPAAARLAVGEVITNLAASGIKQIKDIRLCANWMAAVDDGDQLHQLYQSVWEVTQELCPELELSIPVGKDSLFMKAEWEEEEQKYRVISPVSLVMSGLAQVRDLRYGLSPQLDESGELWLIALRAEPSRLGGSALYQSINHWSGETPNLDEPKKLKDFFSLISELTRHQVLSAYHDCSDGGIWAALCEMAFTANCGLKIELDSLMEKEKSIYSALFNEELGALVQVKPDRKELFHQLAKKYQLDVHPIANPVAKDEISIRLEEKLLLTKKMTELRSDWHGLSDVIREGRGDNPDCVRNESIIRLNKREPGLREEVAFDLKEKYQSITAYSRSKPRVAILRTQGINGQREMAAAFSRAGFSAHDVHMNDLLQQREKGLKDYKGVVFCGGFSYGDALGAGSGWAAKILLNPYLREQFETFFHRKDSFTLGVCNGCQTLAKMARLIPGANWQCDFLPNESRRFEARTVMVKIPSSPSIFFSGMEESLLPVASAHMEGKASFSSENQAKKIQENHQVALFYADSEGQPTQYYPFNPNGSTQAIAALTTKDGRATVLMPHPERVLRRLAQNWRKPEIHAMKKAADDYASDSSPWFAMFLNARLWVG